MGISERLSVNLLGFQLIWWLCILYGNSLLLISVGLLVLHVWLHSSPWLELKTVLLTACLGFGVDLLLTWQGVFQFTGHSTPPLWLFVLWCGFCATLRISLRFFQQRYRLAALLGSVGGSTTYLAAYKLDAMTLGYSLGLSFILLSLVWLCLFPLLMLLSETLSEPSPPLSS